MLRARGADVIAYPSAFTVRTGAAHWEPLLRSRAIETQTYVIGAAAVGQHSENRSTWGHTMVRVWYYEFAESLVMCMLRLSILGGLCLHSAAIFLLKSPVSVWPT